MQRQAINASLTGLVGLLLIPAALSAQEEDDRFSTELTLELQTDVTTSADDPEDKITDVQGKAESTSVLRLAPDLSMEAGLVFQSLGTPSGGRDRFFESHGLIVEQAHIRYAPAGFEIFAGKFNPRFGRAWGQLPGIYADGFAKDYEFVEALGAGVRVDVGEGGVAGRLPGEQEIGLSIYRQDRTVLSDSLFYSRGRTPFSSGGPANTSGFSSAALTWQGSDLPGPDLEYNLGASYRTGGHGDPRDEFGLVAGLLGSRNLSDELELTGVAEVAHFWNAEAQRQDRLNTSIGARFDFRGDWHLVLAYARRDFFSDAKTRSTDHLFELSAGYRFESGFGVDVGHVASRESDDWARGVGLLASFSKDF